jgi:Cu/Ag efflux protein CusF
MMKKLVVPAVAALMALSTSFAWAWSDVTGVIKSINVNAHELVLDDGKTYTVPQTINLSTFKTGDKVMVSTQIENGKNMVNKMTKAG